MLEVGNENIRLRIGVGNQRAVDLWLNTRLKGSRCCTALPQLNSLSYCGTSVEFLDIPGNFDTDASSTAVELQDSSALFAVGALRQCGILDILESFDVFNQLLLNHRICSQSIRGSRSNRNCRDALHPGSFDLEDEEQALQKLPQAGICMFIAIVLSQSDKTYYPKYAGTT
ncbi:hypothetical protein C8R44DRAFT_731409 [Mycena epipterygia]|nr:hypothetical protein C8R44DRAFT_731409 [Mycena epipterygia]